MCVLGTLAIQPDTLANVPHDSGECAGAEEHAYDNDAPNDFQDSFPHHAPSVERLGSGERKSGTPTLEIAPETAPPGSPGSDG
jgi:hypothetical protein